MIKAIKNFIIKVKAEKTIKADLEAVCISKAYPTQYEIRYLGVMGAYIRVRGGIVSIYLTPNAAVDYTAICIYAKNFSNRKLNCLSEKEMQRYINIAKTKLTQTLVYDAIASREI